MTHKKRKGCGHHRFKGCGWDRVKKNKGDRSTSPNRLFRSGEQGILFGVCTGIANYFGINPWIVRGLFIVAAFMFTPAAIIAYIVMACVVPKEPERLYENKDEEHFWRDVRVDPARKFSELRHRFRELEQRLRGVESYVTSDAYRLHKEIDDL
ncbi:MAG: envelope stress response membrane protein PspC [Rhodospirillales bacterium]|nr:envelope stress response membrane protein PspC [Rhodospirillales bacterium]